MQGEGVALVDRERLGLALSPIMLGRDGSVVAPDGGLPAAATGPGPLRGRLLPRRGAYRGRLLVRQIPGGEAMNIWRDRARPIVAEAIDSGRKLGFEGNALKKHVSAAYPFGERAMHPYKIWLDEVKRQLGQGPPSGMPARPADMPGQGMLF